MSNLTCSNGFGLDLRSTYNLLSGAYRSLREHRVKVFLDKVDLCYERMTPEKKAELNDYVHSPEGQRIMGEYAEAILHSPSNTAKMAMAMLYCKDPDFDFTDGQIKVFVKAMVEMTDDLIEFFLLAISQRYNDREPYPTSVIYKVNYQPFREKGWDEALIIVYGQELIKRNLLLPNHSSPTMSDGAGRHGWGFVFGANAQSKKMAALLRKAREYS